jgi:hypothetical protein
MPTGVQVTIGAAAGSGGGDPTLEAQYFLAGTSQRGDIVKPIVARSYAEFTDLCGARTTAGFAHDSVRAFFGENEGVGRVVFARTVGPGTVNAATVTLKDRSGAGGVNTLVATAANPGSWGAGIAVVVTDGFITNTYNIAVTYGGATVETFANLTSPADAVTAAAASLWVRFTNSGSVTAAPTNNPLAGTFSLVGGADDVANVAQSHLVSALDRFGPEYGPGLVAIPGQPQTVAASLAAHCALRNRSGVVSPAAGTAYSAAITLARGLRATTNARTLRMIHPWVTLPADGEAGVRTVSPEGFYAGRRAATIGRVGVWQPPAGDLGQAVYILGPEYAMTAAQRDALVDDAVVPIVATPSTRIYGDRSLAADEITWRFGSYTEEANAIAYDCATSMEGLVGRAIDGLRGAFFADMRTRLVGILAFYADQGGLSPGDSDPGYTVSLSGNNATTLGLGHAVADVSFRPPGVAELIQIRLTKSGFTTTIAA